MRSTLILICATALSACGGGGSSSTVDRPTDPASLGLTQTSPTAGATGVNPDGGVLSATFKVRGFSGRDLSRALSCSAGDLLTVADENWNATTEQLTLQATYDGLPADANCTLSGRLVASNATGPSALDWSVSFSTGKSSALQYARTVVGILGGRPFAVSATAPFTVRRAPVLYVPGPLARPAPQAASLGRNLTPSGRVPVALSASFSSGPAAIAYRFNPVSAQWSSDVSFDPLPPLHTYSGIGSSFALGSGWFPAEGGPGQAPTPNASHWTPDGNGGWFLVESTRPDTLWHRDPLGVLTLVLQEPGLQFSALRTFSR